jgi:hypothetical protein
MTAFRRFDPYAVLREEMRNQGTLASLAALAGTSPELATEETLRPETLASLAALAGTPDQIGTLVQVPLIANSPLVSDFENRGPHPAKAAKLAKVGKGDSDAGPALMRIAGKAALPRTQRAKGISGALEERAAIVEDLVGVPREWTEGLAVLCAMPAPTGFSAARWKQIIEGASAFLQRWGSEAARSGWTTLDVFGCHGDRPDIRFDCMGIVLLLDRAEVTAVDPQGATLKTVVTGSEQRFRRRLLPANTVPLWRLQCQNPRQTSDANE